MHSNMLVECYLSLYLLWLHASQLVGMLLVNELYGDDGLVGVFGTCLADEGVGSTAYCTRDEAEWKVDGQFLSLYLV